MHPPAKLSDLIFALESESEEIHTYFDRYTGQIISVEDTILHAVEEGDDEELTDLPDWQQEEVETARAIVDDAGDRFIDPPDKFEFHEYRHMERFIGSLSDQEAAEELARAIKGRGAFRCFKDTLHRLGIQDAWYRYRDEAMKRFVIEGGTTGHPCCERLLRSCSSQHGCPVVPLFFTTWMSSCSWFLTLLFRSELSWVGRLWGGSPGT